jgi:hypothetical protein
MSFQAMAWAVKQKTGNAGQKLALIMLANYCNSHTGQCNPSHKRLADECSMGVSTLKAHLQALEEIGLLQIVHKSNDGVQLPNQYYLNLEGVGQNLTGGGSESDGGVGQNLATNLEVKPIKEPIIYTPLEKQKKLSLKNWIEKVLEKGEKPISTYKPVYEYAEKIGLPIDYLELCWLEFKRKNLDDDTKKYIDWRRAFYNCLQNNWYKLWWLGDSGYQLTTAGQQADKYHAGQK